MTHGAIQQLNFRKPARPALIWYALRTIVRSWHLKIQNWNGEIHEFGDRTGKTVAVLFRGAGIERAQLPNPEPAIAEGYLEGSEVSSRYQNFAEFQIQLTKRTGAVPFTRDYLYVQKQDAGGALEAPF